MAPAALHAACDADEVLALDGAGTGDDLELVAADLDAVAAVDDGVLGVELAVGALERGSETRCTRSTTSMDLEQERVDLVVSPTRPIVSFSPRETSVFRPFLNPADDMATASSLALCFKIAIMVCLSPRWIALCKNGPHREPCTYGA